MSGVQNTGFEEDNARTIYKNEKETFEIDESQNHKDNIIDEVRDNVEKEEFSDKILNFLKEHKKAIRNIILILLNIGVAIYFGFATKHYINDDSCFNCGIKWCDGYGMLLLLLFFTYFGLFYFQVIKRFWGNELYETCLKPSRNLIRRLFESRMSKIIAGCAVLAAFIVFLVFETADDRERLRPLSGVFTLLLLGFLFSKHPTQVRWRPVIIGTILQFLLGLFCIRWDVGRSIFECFGNKVTTFLNYAHAGAEFVYGEFLVTEKGVFAFAALTVIFFFSCMISILYYIGVMQFIITKLGWILQSLLGTTVCESVNSAANIFLGQSESPLLIRPYIKYLTKSELHSIMTAGFATVAGSVLAAYISFGANPALLITSTVMAAPAGLAFSKLFYPETHKSITSSKNIQMEKPSDTSVLDAATNGAIAAIFLIQGIIANLIAFVAFIAFLNGVLGWFGLLVGEDNLTLEYIFGKIFIPVAWLIGVKWEDCERVGQIIGLKTVVNEFVAFQDLGRAMNNEEISARSAAITTFAICGFANPSSMGIMIGALGSMAPERKPYIASVAFRGFIAGTCVCFITASFAALLMTPDMFNTVGSGNQTKLFF